MQRVEVCWTDSGTFIHGWKDLTELPEAGKIHTVTTIGHLVHEDDEAIYIGLSLDDEQRGVYGVQVIQRTAIKHVHTLGYMSNVTENHRNSS